MKNYIGKLSTTFKIKLQKVAQKCEIGIPIIQDTPYVQYEGQTDIECEIGIPIIQDTPYVQYEGQTDIEVHGGLSI